MHLLKCLWKVLRYLQENKQNFPTFSGWQVLVRKVQILMELKKTSSCHISANTFRIGRQVVVTYLPPIDDL